MGFVWAEIVYAGLRMVDAGKKKFVSTIDSLNYAKARLALAKTMGDADEIAKWSEHVAYWLAQLEQ